MVRAKFILQEVTSVSYNPTAKKLKFAAQYDPSIPEDQRFAEATPSGSMEFYCTNPVALEQLEIGKQYYLDLSPAE